MSVLRLTVILIALLLSTTATALTHLNANDGLSGGTVFAIRKDCYGLMWFATSNGLDCYNGLTFSTYTASGKRSNNVAKDIAQTADGKIYVATEGGLYTPDLTNSGRLRPVALELKEAVNTLVANGNTLYAGTETGLYIVEGEKVSEHLWPVADRLSKQNHVADLLMDSTRLWVLTANDLYQFDIATRQFTCMEIGKQMHVGNDLRVMVKAGPRIFIGTYNDGLFTYDLQKHHAERYTAVGSGVITDMQVEDGNLFVATDGAGVSVISLSDDGVVRTHNTQNGLLDNSVYSFLRTPMGDTWFGYFRRGLTVENVARPLFKVFEGDGFSTRGLNVRSFCIDGDDIVVGTREGLYLYDGHGVRYYSAHELDGGSIITSIVKYAGEYYFATFDHGVYRLNGATGRVSRFGGEELLRTASFGKLAISGDGKLWMAGNAGVFVYDAATDNLTHYDHRNSHLYDSYANSLLFDRNGRCWIGTHEGMCVYNPADGVLRSDGFPQDFNNRVSEPIFVLGLDDDIVSYSADGLYRTDESLSDYGEAAANDVLNGALISIVACDTVLRQYWVGTERGLFCFDGEFGRYRKYGTAYGMESSEFSTGAYFIDSERRLWIGTMGGLYYVGLDEVDKAEMPGAAILLAGVSVGGHAMSDDEELLMLRNHELSLSYLGGAEELAFQPTLLNYAEQHDVYYEYRVGDDGEWRTIGSGAVAVCKDFSIGKNVLYVRVAGTDVMTAYVVKVRPSAWLIVQVVVVVALIVTLIFYQRNRKELVKVKEDLAEERAKYSRVRMNDEESERLFARLKEYVVKHESYLDPELKMSDLAAALECSTVRLSQLLNMYAEQNYYDFINSYRIEEFKRRLEDPKYSQYTLVALSEMCGFKKSSFFSTFKKMEGVTPAEYVKRVRG